MKKLLDENRFGCIEEVVGKSLLIGRIEQIRLNSFLFNTGYKKL